MVLTKLESELVGEGEDEGENELLLDRDKAERKSSIDIEHSMNSMNSMIQLESEQGGEEGEKMGERESGEERERERERDRCLLLLQSANLALSELKLKSQVLGWAALDTQRGEHKQGKHKHIHAQALSLTHAKLSPANVRIYIWPTPMGIHIDGMGGIGNGIGNDFNEINKGSGVLVKLSAGAYV